MTGLISYYETIGDILQKQGKLKEALAAYQKALQYYPQRDRVREKIVKIENILKK
jgi:predicted negative regulator of RcsB-dependent stress response